ncbi:MAG: UbiA family prenyltransferase, partial [Bacteroidota bacterium]|nr:UbiA family prenyltransferase [Bacteroidota bacterium]
MLLIALTQILVHYGFLKALGLPTALSDLNFFILSLATLFIAAAGYIINDIQDVAIDRINKPNKTFIPSPFSQNSAFNYYLVLNISGVGLGFLLSYQMGFGNFATLFVLISALLYVYANFLKRVLLIGNLIVSAIVASAIGIVMVFDTIPVLQGNEQQLVNPLSVLKDYAVFALMLNFHREIVKDIEDANGDYAAGIQSFPILLGLERTSK